MPEKPDSRTAREARESPPDEEAIRRRAYEISLSADAGTPEANWLRAEQELRTVADAAA